MSIDVYKEINKDVIDKVQYLKKVNALLENEVTMLNAKYFEEHQLRIEEKHKILSVVSHLESEIRNVKRYILGEDIGSQWLINATRSSRGRITHSSGITTRSPVRSRSSEFNAVRKRKSFDNMNPMGFSNIEEVSGNTERNSAYYDNGNDDDADADADDDEDDHSYKSSNEIERDDEMTIDILRVTSQLEKERTLNDLRQVSIESHNHMKSINYRDDSEKTLLALSNLNINNEHGQNDDTLSFEEKSQYDGTDIQVLSSDESQGKVDVQQNLSELEREKNWNNILNDTNATTNDENFVDFEMNGFSSNLIVSSTPINGKPNDKTTESPVTMDNNATDSNNTTTRPRRRCVPTSLAEPKVNVKLRNESSTKTKSQKSKKAKGK